MKCTKLRSLKPWAKEREAVSRYCILFLPYWVQNFILCRPLLFFPISSKGHSCKLAKQDFLFEAICNCGVAWDPSCESIWFFWAWFLMILGCRIQCFNNFSPPSTIINFEKEVFLGLNMLSSSCILASLNCTEHFYFWDLKWD